MVSSKKNKSSSVHPMEDDLVFTMRKSGRPGVFSGGGDSSVPNGSGPHSAETLSSGKGSCDGLEALGSANMIFVKQVQQELAKIANPNKYQVLMSNGERILQAIESSNNSVTRAMFRDGQSFAFRVVDNEGYEVMSIDGHPGDKVVGASATVRRDNEVVGNVVQTGKMSLRRKRAATYLVEAADGTILQNVQRHTETRCCRSVGTDDFDIYSATNKALCVGRISRQRNSICLEEYHLADTYAVSFHSTQMDCRVKSLLLATVILLDFKYFETRKRSGAIWLRLVIASFLVALLITVAVIVIWSLVDFQLGRSKKFPGKIPRS